MTDATPAATDCVPCSKRPSGTESATADKHQRLVEQSVGCNDGYQPDFSRRNGESPLSRLFPRPMSLPHSTLTAYTMLPEYQEICKEFQPEYISRGWELFRRLEFYDALASYPPEELEKGLVFVTRGILPLYEKIHKEEIQRYAGRNPTDSGYFSRPTSLLPRISSISTVTEPPPNQNGLEHTGSSEYPEIYFGSDTYTTQDINLSIEPGTTTTTSPFGNLPFDIGYEFQSHALPPASLDVFRDGYGSSINQCTDGFTKSHPSQPLIISTQSTQTLANSLHIVNDNPTIPLSVPSADKGIPASQPRPPPNYTKLKRPPANETAHHKKYQCTYCDERFVKEGNRDIHEKNQHDSRYTFNCNHTGCEASPFSSEDGFKKHHRTTHAGCSSTCSIPERTMIRPSKKRAACGVCGKVFLNSNTLQKDRFDHIHQHYKNENPENLYNWKSNHWKRSAIANAFLKLPELMPLWQRHKANKELEAKAQFRLNYSWQNANDQQWNKFIEMVEFDDFSSLESRQRIVEMAYDLADKLLPPKLKHNRTLNGGIAITHLRTPSNVSSSSSTCDRGALDLHLKDDDGAVNQSNISSLSELSVSTRTEASDGVKDNAPQGSSNYFFIQDPIPTVHFHPRPINGRSKLALRNIHPRDITIQPTIEDTTGDGAITSQITSSTTFANNDHSSDDLIQHLRGEETVETQRIDTDPNKHIGAEYLQHILQQPQEQPIGLQELPDDCENLRSAFEWDNYDEEEDDEEKEEDVSEDVVNSHKGKKINKLRRSVSRWRNNKKKEKED